MNSSDRYQIGDLICGEYRVFAKHRGYLGIVYLARSDSGAGDAKDYAAIKTFRLDETVCRTLFDRELANWASVPQHPNLVGAKRALVEQKLLFLEFVLGPSLAEIANHAPVHPRHFIAWTRQVGEALRFLHVENHFVHRDMRPANVLIDSRGLVARVSDLGLGKPLDPELGTHTTIGTFNYMAPEVFEGKTDYRSDIFSYGATLYYILTGRNAVRRSTENLERLPPPSKLLPEIPKEVDAIVDRALAPAPDSRYSSMDELLADFATIEEWEPLTNRYLECRTCGLLHDPDRECRICRHVAKIRAVEFDVLGS